MRSNWIVSLLGLSILTGCATAGPVEDVPEPVRPEWMDVYRIGLADKVQVHVWRNPELSSIVPVRYDGKISLPLVGDVDVEGKTPEAVAADIEAALAEYVRNPHVSVIVTETNSHSYLSRVRVTGAVENPISVAHLKGMTVLDAVLAAGGVSEFAAPGRTRLYRKTEQGTVAIPVRLDDILESGGLETNYALQPGDVITIPRRIL